MSTQPCPLPYAVTIHGDRPASVTPCDRWAGHGGRCAPPEPEPVTVGCDVAADGTAGLVIGYSHGHVPRPDPSTGYWYDRIANARVEGPRERTINEERTLIGLPPLPYADSKWFRHDATGETSRPGATIYGIPVETDTSVPVDHFEIRQDGAVLATVRMADATAATFLAYDPARPTFGDDRTIATPEAVHDAVRRYADLQGIEMHTDAEWKAHRDAANERESNLHPNPTFEEVPTDDAFPDGWQTVGWTSPDSFSFTFETEHLNADLLRAVYGHDWNRPRTMTVTRPRETLADRAVTMLASRRPTIYRPQGSELAPTPSWIKPPSVAAVWKIVDRILDRMPTTSDDLRAAAQAALRDRHAPPRNIKTLAEHMNFTRGAIEHTCEPRLRDILAASLGPNTWTPSTPTRDEMLANMRKAAESVTYQPFIDVIHPAEWERRQRNAAANVVKGLTR